MNTEDYHTEYRLVRAPLKSGGYHISLGVAQFTGPGALVAVWLLGQGAGCLDRPQPIALLRQGLIDAGHAPVIDMETKTELPLDATQ